MRRHLALVLVFAGAVAIGLAGWGYARPAAAHPNYTYVVGCHCNPNPTPSTTARTTTTTASTSTTLPSTTTTASTTTTSTTGPPVRSGFSDVQPSHAYFSQISDLATRRVIGGFADGTFKPDRPVTRQQFAKMIVLALGYRVTEGNICPFGDVASNLDLADPLYPDHYVAVCAARNITQGKRPGEFAPYDNVTRAQLITMVARAAGLPEPPTGYTPAFADFSPDHFVWARKAASAGLLRDLTGMGAGYDFLATASRGEVCVLLFSLLHR
jgi:hypothetical protein